MTAPRPECAADVATLLGGSLEGPGSLPVRGLAALDDATEDQATFIADEPHARRWAASRAGVAVVTRTLEVPGHDASSRTLVRVEDAEQAIISLLEAFAPAPERPARGVHPMAWVHPEAGVSPEVYVGPFASVERGAQLAAGVVLHPGACVGAEARIGERSVLHANAVVRERCRVGRDCVLHAGAVVGSDGFGYRPAPDGRGLRRVPHLGVAILEDGVELGAGSCVDRAKFGATVVGAGTKIDNLCQVGHNVRIGRSCVIAGLTGIAGSAVIEDAVRIGGGCGVGDHIRIGRGATLAARSAVMNDVPAGQTWGGTPAQDAKAALRELAAVRKLPEWSKKLRRLVEGG